MKRPLLRLTCVTLLAYVGVCLAFAGCQNKLLYFPAKHTESAELDRAKHSGLEPWRDARGQLIGWKRPVARAAGRLVVFHGNGGSALDRIYYPEAFGPALEVYLFEYPGYGSREGSPGKAAFITAGRAAVEELTATDRRPLFLLGESVGSGTAAALAGAMPEKIAGIVMMIPFARLAEVAKAKFPWLPVSLLLRDKFDNIAALQNFNGPAVFVIAERDEVVGAAQGHKLHDAYTGPKKLIVLPGATHNSFPSEPGAPWFRETVDFLRK